MLLFKWDKELWSTRQRVVQNKHARHNLNFGHEKQSNNFEELKKEAPKLKERLNSLPKGSDEYLEILSKMLGKGTHYSFQRSSTFKRYSIKTN